jgi:hypothetical protein
MYDVFCLSPLNGLLPCHLALCGGLKYFKVCLERNDIHGNTHRDSIHRPFSLGALFTWKVLNSRMVTIIKTSECSTAIYDHAVQRAFKATEAGSLGPGCPVGTSLLAQVIMDRVVESRMDEEGSAAGHASAAAGDGDGAGLGANDAHSDVVKWVPNMLIFDIQSYGKEEVFTLQNTPSPENAHPARRYALLRHISDPCLGIIQSAHMKVRFATPLSMRANKQ